MFPPRMAAPELALVARAIYDAPMTDEGRAVLARHFADRLARTNGQFDRERFIRAATTGVNAPMPRTHTAYGIPTLPEPAI